MRAIGKIFFSHIFILLFIYTCGEQQDECVNTPVKINGLLSSASGTIFSKISNLYSLERQKYGRNVVLNATVADTSLIKKGLLGTPSKTMPIVFITQTKNMISDKNELRFPLAASAVVVIYNLPGIDKLTLSLRNIDGIYKGTSEYWNATYISKNNPNVTMPFEKIIPLARKETDSSTGIFTQVLSANDAVWSQKYGAIYDPSFVNGICCNSTKWPQETRLMYVNMTVGMVGVVMSLNYTIGYVTLSSIADLSNVPQAKLIIAGNNPTEVEPTDDAVQAAMAYYMNNSDPDELLLNLGITNDSVAYPMSGFLYFALNKSYTGVDCCIIQELVGFIDWFYFSWANRNLRQLKFTPLLLQLKERIKRVALSKITCNGNTVYDKYLSTKHISSKLELATWIIVLITVGVCVAVGVIGCGAFYYLYLRKVASDESQWLIGEYRLKQSQAKHGKITDLDAMSKKDIISIASGIISETEKSVVTSNHTIKGAMVGLKERMTTAELDHTKVFIDKMDGRPVQHWPKSTKRLMTKMKHMANKNILNLLGVVIQSNSTMAVIFEYASKGTLHYVLKTTKYNITNEMKIQFAIDVANGMKFLHQNCIICGCLNSLTCYMDSSWTVKIAHWQQMTLYALENPKMLFQYGSFSPDLQIEESDLITLLYVDPALRKALTQTVDVYSYGVLLIEIFTGALPYNKEVEDGLASYEEIFHKKFTRNYNMCPKLESLPKKINSLVYSCMTIENHRPQFTTIVAGLNQMTKNSTGIVDIIMDALEKHAEELEEKVEERTSELKTVTEKMRILLNEVLPPQIAEKLFNGEPIPPEYYQCVTIYFSDIVGFTDISAKSSPIQVMALLNDLWIMFDAVIDKFDVYKVDTIGTKNACVQNKLNMRRIHGMQWIANAQWNGSLSTDSTAVIVIIRKMFTLYSINSELLVYIVENCTFFALKIKHMPSEPLKIRIGINSGPVTAGVVGLKMPQYCVFGDTVNTAARMESTSEAQCVQISTCTHTFLEENFPNSFDTVLRGEISVKGKGDMKTYWLKGLMRK